MAKTTNEKSARGKSGVCTALEFLADRHELSGHGLIAMFGEDAFLKSESLAALRRRLLDDVDSDFALTTFSGPAAALRDVLDAITTVSLFGSGGRLVIVEEADPFVTKYRSELEDYVARSAGRGEARSKAGLLVLEVASWPANTRLAKAVAASGLAIDCKPLNERQTRTWLIERAKTRHELRVEPAAADAMLELLPPELGILAQELEKLALVVDERRVVDEKLVRENVGGWRTRAAWDMVDAAADGRAADALDQLGRLIAAGEKPQGLLPQLASSLRKFDTATRLIEAAEADRRSLPLRNALSQSGVLPFKLNDAERQLRHIGRERAKKLSAWLLAADLAVKGFKSADDAARIELERLIVRLS